MIKRKFVITARERTDAVKLIKPNLVILFLCGRGEELLLSWTIDLILEMKNLCLMGKMLVFPIHHQFKYLKITQIHFPMMKNYGK
jgi:hypothetical protein